MDSSDWRQQKSPTPLFPDIEWNKPEQRSRAGKLAIIGGNKLGFIAVAESYSVSHELGAGQIRAILPDVLKKSLPPTITDTLYIASNISGGFSREALPELLAAAAWADVCLLIGDTGRNSETAMAFEQLLTTYHGHLVITRDAVDLLRAVSPQIVSREKTTLIVSFAQLQKLFQNVYYPKILSFSMQLMQLVDILHKFTITYPVTIVTFHQNQLIVAHEGKIITQEYDEPMLIWRGVTAARVASYLLWNPTKPLEAITTSFITS